MMTTGTTTTRQGDIDVDIDVDVDVGIDNHVDPYVDQHHLIVDVDDNDNKYTKKLQGSRGSLSRHDGYYGNYGNYRNYYNGYNYNYNYYGPLQRGHRVSWCLTMFSIVTILVSTIHRAVVDFHIGNASSNIDRDHGIGTGTGRRSGRPPGWWWEQDADAEMLWDLPNHNNPTLDEHVHDRSSSSSSNSNSNSKQFKQEQRKELELETAAACLMYKDDDASLREWIPYHYHTFHLRHLILRIDPTSTTKPDSIINAWKDRINITVWYNDTFIKPQDWKKSNAALSGVLRSDAQAGVKELVLVHDIFINRCLKQMKQWGMGWTLVIDIDEFLRINYKSIVNWKKNHPAPSLFRKATSDDGSKISTKEKKPKPDLGKNWLAQMTTTPPAMSEPNAAMRLLQQQLVKPPMRRPERLRSPCIQMPRSRFGAVESSHRILTQHIPKSLGNNNNITMQQFNTLRYRYHATPDKDVEGNNVGKAMIDLRQVTDQQLQRMGNMHKPVLDVCDQHALFVKQQDQIFVINHYLGSEEQFLGRPDQRRSVEFFREQAQIDDMNDDDIRPWLTGFIQEHGMERATELLLLQGQ